MTLRVNLFPNIAHHNSQTKLYFLSLLYGFCLVVEKIFNSTLYMVSENKPYIISAQQFHCATTSISFTNPRSLLFTLETHTS